MAIKIYSDVTKKFYEDEAAALDAEKALIEKRDAAAEERKHMAQDVDEKRKALVKARAEYREALGKFCEKYGTYHMSLGKKDWDDIWDAFWNW